MQPASQQVDRELVQPTGKVRQIANEKGDSPKETNYPIDHLLRDVFLFLSLSRMYLLAVPKRVVEKVVVPE